MAYPFKRNLTKQGKEGKKCPVPRKTRNLIQTEIERIQKIIELRPDLNMYKLLHFGQHIKTAGIPYYWKKPLLFEIYKNAGTERILKTSAGDRFLKFWKQLLIEFSDDESRFIHILTGGERNYLVPNDFLLLMDDIINTHPGLGLMKSQKELQPFYIKTVITRIFHRVSSCTSRLQWRIELSELRNSDLLQIIKMLQKKNDIDEIPHYFSFKSFWVTYQYYPSVRSFVSKHEFIRNFSDVVVPEMIDRIFTDNVVLKLVQNGMSFEDFVWFLVSLVDMNHPKSIEYWFRCLDKDGNGVLSTYEIECFHKQKKQLLLNNYFFEISQQKLPSSQISDLYQSMQELLQFPNFMNQVINMICPVHHTRITLTDLKASGNAKRFFQSLFLLDSEGMILPLNPEPDRSNTREVSEWDIFIDRKCEEFKLPDNLMPAPEDHEVIEISSDGEIELLMVVNRPETLG